MATKLTLDYHATKLVDNVASLFDVNDQANKYSDVEIKIGNRTFYCHKLILQLNSEYLSTLVQQRQDVTLQSIDPDQFYNVLQFMYTGDVAVSTSNIESLLTAADVLGLDDLQRVCFRFLEDDLNIDNSLLYWKLANMYEQTGLASKCQTVFCKDLKKLNSVSNLTNASEEMMKVILSDDSLDVKSEVQVCEMLMKWLQVRTEAGHEVHPDQLLPLIRWSGISVDYVKSKLLQNTSLTSDPASISFLTKVITYLLSGVQFEDLQTFHRPSSGLQNCLMTVGTFDFCTVSSEVYCISLRQPDKVKSLSEIPTSMSGSPDACLLNNNVYIIGTGKTPSQETWTWNLVSGWSRCADMLTGRMFHRTAAVDSMLYVLGGSIETSNTTLSSVECYNTKTNKWSSAGQLIHAVKLAACATYNNFIYLFGGEDKDHATVGHVQVYNPAQESCTLMNQSMPCAYSHMRAVSWENSVMLLGESSCFIFNFETEAWQVREQFKTGVRYFGVAICNSMVFVACGGTKKTGKNHEVLFTCTDEIKSVSVQDIIQDRPAIWRQDAKFPKSFMIDAHVIISLP